MNELLAHVIVIVAVIAFTEIVKGIVKAVGAKAKIEPFYVLIPLVLGTLIGWPVSLALGHTEWYWIVLACFLYGAVSAYLWKTGKELVLSWLPRLLGLGQ
jgi:hypothetical protein